MTAQLETEIVRLKQKFEDHEDYCKERLARNRWALGILVTMIIGLFSAMLVHLHHHHATEHQIYCGIPGL